MSRNLPGWFTAILLAIIGFLVVRDVRNIDHTLTSFRQEMRLLVSQVNTLDTRVTVLEADQEARR